MARALLKTTKIYFYDTGQVRGDNGVRFENLVACALLKELHRREDENGDRTELHYCRMKDGREIDFAVLVNGAVQVLVECEWSDPSVSPAFLHLAVLFPKAKPVQLVAELRRDLDLPTGVHVRRAAPWLAAMTW